MQTLMSLRTTDGLDKRGLGIGKKWLAKDEARRKLMWDLILKINYSIQDFNATIEGGGVQRRAKRCHIPDCPR